MFSAKKSREFFPGIFLPYDLFDLIDPAFRTFDRTHLDAGQSFSPEFYSLRLHKIPGSPV